MSSYPKKPTFGVGARVKVIKQSKYPCEKLLGLVGTVKSDYGCEVAVLFDTIENRRSAHGYYYFKPVELAAVDEFDNEIVKEKNMHKINNYLNIARVKYVNVGNKSGVFQYANFEPDLEADDLCVVRSEEDTFLVAKVVDIVDCNDVEMFREVVAKVHTGSYDTRVECRKKAAELKAKMEARAKQLQDVALYQMLAKDDPDMAALLQEYQGVCMV